MRLFSPCMWFALVSLMGKHQNPQSQLLMLFKTQNPPSYPDKAFPSSLGGGFPGRQAPRLTHSKPQAVAPGLSFPGLLCWYSPPLCRALIRVRRFELSDERGWGNSTPLLSLQSQAWERGRLPPPTLTYGCPHWEANSHSRTDFPKLHSPTACNTRNPPLIRSILVTTYRCLSFPS